MTPKNLSRIFNDVSRQPARRFEQETGLTGIAGDYVFPDGFSASMYEDHYTWQFGPHGGFAQIPGVLAGSGLPEETQDAGPPGCGLDERLRKTSEGYRQLLSEGWHRLETLNPDLKKLAFDRRDPAQVYNALLGVTSGFNRDDINFFLKLLRMNVLPGQYARKLPGFSALREEIEQKTGEGMYWVASRETMEAVVRKIHEKAAAPALKTAPFRPR